MSRANRVVFGYGFLQLIFEKSNRVERIISSEIIWIFLTVCRSWLANIFSIQRVPTNPGKIWEEKLLGTHCKASMHSACTYVLGALALVVATNNCFGQDSIAVLPSYGQIPLTCWLPGCLPGNAAGLPFYLPVCLPSSCRRYRQQGPLGRAAALGEPPTIIISRLDCWLDLAH